MEHLQLVFQWVPGQSWWGTWWEIPPSYTRLSLKHLSMTSARSVDWMCVCSTCQRPAQPEKKRINSCEGERKGRHGRRGGVDRMRRRTDERHSYIQMTGVRRIQIPTGRGLCAVIEQLQSTGASRNAQRASNTVLCPLSISVSLHNITAYILALALSTVWWKKELCWRIRNMKLTSAPPGKSLHFMATSIG